MKPNYDSLLEESEKLEKKYLKKLNTESNVAYKQIRKVIAEFFGLYEVDGVFNESMYKYGRDQRMTSEAINSLRVITVTNVPTLKAYLNQIYKTNYYGTGYVVENKYSVITRFRQYSEDALKDRLLRPLDKISLKNNSQTVRIGIQRDIQSGIAQGDTFKQMTKRVARTLEKNGNNAARIIRTETTRTISGGRLDSLYYLRDHGVELEKVWETTGDNSVRDTHSYIDGEAQPLDKVFGNGLMYPGDPSGLPEEVINCRCILTERLVETAKTQATPIDDYDEWYGMRVI